MKVLRKVGFVSAMLMMLMAMMLVTPSTSAYFWSDSPESWGYGDDPIQVPAQPDGTGEALINPAPGECLSILYGGSEGNPTPVDFTNYERDHGESLMFCVAYDLSASIYGKDSNTWAIASLEYYIWMPPPINDWVFGKSMTASIQTFHPAIEFNQDDGWLYVYIDYNYFLEPKIMLTLTTYAQYWEYGWVDFPGSPYSVSVFFQVNDLTY